MSTRYQWDPLTGTYGEVPKKKPKAKEEPKESKWRLHIQEPQFLFPYYFCKSITAKIDGEKAAAAYRNKITEYYKKQFSADLKIIQADAGISTFPENAFDNLAFGDIEKAEQAIMCLLIIIERLRRVTKGNKNWLSFEFSADHRIHTTDILAFRVAASSIERKINVILDTEETAYYSADLKAHPARLFFRENTSFRSTTDVFTTKKFAEALANERWNESEIAFIRKEWPKVIAYNESYTAKQSYRISSSELSDPSSFLFTTVARCFFKRMEKDPGISTIERMLTEEKEVIVPQHEVKDFLHKTEKKTDANEKKRCATHFWLSAALWLAELAASGGACLLVLPTLLGWLVEGHFNWDSSGAFTFLIWIIPTLALCCTIPAFDSWALYRSAPRGLSVLILIVGNLFLAQPGGFHDKIWGATPMGLLVMMAIEYLPTLIFLTFLFFKERLLWLPAKRRRERKTGKVWFCSWVGPGVSFFSVIGCVFIGGATHHTGTVLAIFLWLVQCAALGLLSWPLFDVDSN